MKTLSRLIACVVSLVAALTFMAGAGVQSDPAGPPVKSQERLTGGSRLDPSDIAAAR